MFLFENETLLTNGAAKSAFGHAFAFYDNYLLSALYRAIVIDKGGERDLEVIAEKSAISYAVIPSGCQKSQLIQESLESQNSAFSIALAKKETILSKDEKIDGWETFDNLNRYLSQIATTEIYINRDKKQAIVFAEKEKVRGSANVSEDWLQALCSMLFMVLPWYYPDKNEETAKFFRSISVGNKDISSEDAKKIVVEYINGVALKLDIKNLVLQKQLKGFSKRKIEAQAREKRDALVDLHRSIDRYTEDLKNLYDRVATEKRVLSALEMYQPSDDDEFLTFFQEHKNLTVSSVVGETIYYNVVDTLEFYDEDEARDLFENKGSWAYMHPSKLVSNALKTIFVENRGIIRVCASFSLSGNNLVSPIRDRWEETSCMPNPHIYFFACSGANDTYYSQYAKQGEWALAIEQSISATKNWSVGDSVVGREMFKWFTDMIDEAPCIYVTDGSPIHRVTDECRLVTLREYIKIVADKKASESEETTNG